MLEGVVVEGPTRESHEATLQHVGPPQGVYCMACKKRKGQERV